MKTTLFARAVPPAEIKPEKNSWEGFPTPMMKHRLRAPAGESGARRSDRRWLGLAAAAGLLLFGARAPAAEADQTVYFLVGEPIPRIPVPGQPTPESFLLPLSDPAAIAHARCLIANAPSYPYYPPRECAAGTVIIRVVKTSDWSNRDFYRPGFPAWSWRVVEFKGFADIVEWELFSRPSVIEREFIEAPNEVERTFAFFAFALRELGPGALYLSAARQGEQLQFSWSGVWPEAEYAIEAAARPDGPDWTPVVTGLRPGRTNLWSMPLPEGPARFYRLRAQLPGP